MSKPVKELHPSQVSPTVDSFSQSCYCQLDVVIQHQSLSD